MYAPPSDIVGSLPAEIDQNQGKEFPELFSMQHPAYKLLRRALLRLSEKSLRCPRSSPTGSQEVPFWPISCSAWRPNSRLERCPNTFSDSLSTHSGEYGLWTEGTGVTAFTERRPPCPLKGRSGADKEVLQRRARPNANYVSAPEVGPISVICRICPIFGWGNCLTRTSESC